MPTLERSSLHVEGPDDVHTIHHLLLRHGFDCPTKDGKRSDSEFLDNVPEIKAAGDHLKVLDAMSTAPKTSTNRSVGFVLDADEMLENRWNAVRNRFRQFNLDLPNNIPEGGFVDEIAKFKVRVGVWLMPDNQRSGALEEFLSDLVDEKDCLISLAFRSTDEAKSKGANFPEGSKSKAVLRAWLAWQKTPGLPYGVAIKAQYFRVDSPAANSFVEWYKKLFDDG